MKKLLVAASIVIALGMTSCKKDYNCDCRDTGTGKVFETTQYPNTGLIDARNACKDRQSFWQNTAKPATECTIL